MKVNKGSWVEAVSHDMSVVSGVDAKYSCELSKLCQCFQNLGSPKPFKKLLISPILSMDVPPEKELKAPDQDFQCYICNKQFYSLQSFSLHQFKAHGIRNLCRQYVAGSVCPLCLVNFHTRERLLNHVRYRSIICRKYVMKGPPPLSMEEADQLDADDRLKMRQLRSAGNRKHSATRDDGVCHRAHGPLLHNIDVPNPSTHHPFGKGRNYKC